MATRHSTHQVPIVPGARVRYLADIADTVRGYKRRAREQAALAREIQQLRASARACCTTGKPDKPPRRRGRDRPGRAARGAAGRRTRSKLLAMWPDMQKAYAGDEYVVKIRDKEIRTALVAHHAVGQQDPQGRAAAATRTTARS